MRDKDLVERLAAASQVDTEAVQAVLYHLPEVLYRLPIGDWVKTPLGSFRMIRRKPYMVKSPRDGSPVAVPPERILKLRAGVRVRGPCD